VLEAMAQGTAVITSSGTATEEVIGEAGVVVDPADPEALLGALDALLGDPRRREQLGAAAHRRVLETFDPRTHAHALESLYREAAGRAAGESRS
jgi:glycosyltransferase involved in cell wall biosynthesis